MRIDKKRISNPNVRGQIQITLDVDGLKEAEIPPWTEVNVIYIKNKIIIVKDEDIGVALEMLK